MSSDSSPSPSAPLEELIRQRRDRKDRCAASGARPYGRRFERTDTLQAIHVRFSDAVPAVAEEGTPAPVVQVAGRLLTRRDLGKLCFAHLHDHTGRLQIKVSRAQIGEGPYKTFTREIDLGDVMGVSGPLVRTKTGELTVEVAQFELLSKSLRPWPEKFHGLTDVEARSRQRELDLATSAESLRRFTARSEVIQSLRETLVLRGFLEVETPMMQPVPGGAAAKPFITHHEALDLDLYLRVAPELYLKRLLVGGFEKVYEIGRAFRNEGIDTRHNPEFTILEAYQAYADVTDMMDVTEALIQGAARKLGVGEVTYRGETVDVSQPFARRSLVDLFRQYVDVDLVGLARGGGWPEAARAAGIGVPAGATARKCFDLLFDERILPHLDRPTFVLDFPAVFSPLAKVTEGAPELAERFELFLAKEEVANAYSEQNDPDEQRRRFREELAKRQAGDDEAMPVDAAFLTALEYGMPPAGGLGIGVDRLTMVLTGASSIREVILFPLLRPIA